MGTIVDDYGLEVLRKCAVVDEDGNYSLRISYGSAVLKVSGSNGAPISITAAGGITYLAGFGNQLIYIEGDGGDVDITSVPQISDGNSDGDTLELRGRNSSNKVLLEHGSGLSLNGPFNMGEDDSITLKWDTTNWVEVSRREMNKFISLLLLLSMSAGATGNRVIDATKVRNGSGSLSVPTSTNISATELSYVSGVTSSIQTQLNGKQAAGSVNSFNSRTGIVVPATNDYTWAQVNKTVSSLNDITTRSVTNVSASDVGLTINGASSQSGNLLEFRNNATTILSKVDSTGKFSNTPTFTATAVQTFSFSAGFGTAASQHIFCHRYGDRYHCQGEFIAGTLAGSLAYITLPNSLSVDTAKLTSTTNNAAVGIYNRVSAGANQEFFDSGWQGYLFYSSSVGDATRLYFAKGANSGTPGMQALNPGTFMASSDGVTIEFDVPISGWNCCN